MQIDIKTHNLSLTDAIQDHVERRIRFALACCDDYIQRVVVRLYDINGPRGGEDMRCRLHFSLDGMPDTLIEDTSLDLYVAIDRSANRAGRTIRRKINRQKTLFRYTRSPVLGEA